MQLRDFFSFLFPAQAAVSHREKILSGVGALIAIIATGWISSHFIDPSLAPILIASMGASSVLLLGAPHSPLSQPWSFAGGHLVSALVGVTCAALVPSPYLAAGLAVGLAITAMYYLRCLHPPGGATAFMVVIGDAKVHALGYHFIVTPLLLNIVILLATALIFNNLTPGRRYPLALHLPGKGNAPSPSAKPPVKLSFDDEDLRSALREMDGYIDVAEEDLTRIYALATLHAHQRGLDSTTLSNIMTHQVVTVGADVRLEQVWELLRRHHIRGIPVVDKERRVIGMISIADFLKQVNWRMCETLIQRLKLMFKWQSKILVREVMSEPAITAPEDTSLTTVFLIFAENGINHLPVVDGDNRLVGIVTRLDLLAALYGDRTGTGASPGKTPLPI